MFENRTRSKKNAPGKIKVDIKCTIFEGRDYNLIARIRNSNRTPVRCFAPVTRRADRKKRTDNRQRFQPKQAGNDEDPDEYL